MFKKLLVSLMVLGLIFTFTGNGMACEGPECQNYTDVEASGWIYTPAWGSVQYSHNGTEDFAYNGGWSGHMYDVYAKGTESAFATVTATSTMSPFGFAFQKEINGGELSGAFSKTTASGEIEGYAKGVDSPDCDTGLDKASVDLSLELHAYQRNGAYSDDRDSFIGGWNESFTHAVAQTDSYDGGSNYDQWVKTGKVYKKRTPGQGWMYKTFPVNANPHGWRFVKYEYKKVRVINLTAETSDSLSGKAETFGGTFVYAKQTNDKAFVGGITFNVSGMNCFNGAEHVNVDVAGNGTIGGAAVLPDQGYAGFNASYNYVGMGFGAGLAGGVATVQNQTTPNGGVSVTSNVTAFSGVAVGGSIPQ